MFTGIIETMGTVKEVIPNGSNRVFWVESPISIELETDQSLSHNGVCLTVEESRGHLHRVTAIEETLEKTNLGGWKIGTAVNLERCLKLSDRLDGHLVQGHVDTVATCVKIKGKKGTREYEFEFPKKFAELVIEKGSVCVNGVSLTAFDIKKKTFRVAIIPYTYEHTNFHLLGEGETVNLEFDVIGKYLKRHFRNLWF
jgi:riboflavin synthase